MDNNVPNQNISPVQISPSIQPSEQQKISSNISWLKTLSYGFALVSFGIAIGIGGYFLATQKTKSVSQNQQLTPTISQPYPTTDPTADWKTYTNNKIGFKIKYPSYSDIGTQAGLGLGPTNGEEDNFLDFTFPDPIMSNHQYYEGNILIYMMPFTGTVQQFIKSSRQLHIVDDFPFSNTPKKETINGIDMVFYDGGPSTQFKNHLAFFVGKNYAFEFIVTADAANDLQGKPFEILSTFKFTDQILNTKELNEFPVYPNAKFVEKKKQDPCPKDEKASGFSICSTTTYTWQTSDDYDQTNTWYKDDKSNSGWKCSGGAGSYDGPRNANGKTTCRNGNLVYDLSLVANSKETQIILLIPY